MAFDDLRVAFHSIVPESNVGVSAARRNHVSLRGNFHIVYWAFVADKSEGAHGSLEVPYHHRAVFGATYHLFQIGVK